MKSYWFCILFLFFISDFMILPAREGPVRSSGTDERIALVIGNSNYTADPLRNPENDAKAMSRALRNTNFEVLEYMNLETAAEMKKVIREFGRRIKNGGVGLFYYAGHGIQVNGKNYLIPTRAEIYAEEEVEYESLELGFVLAQMEISRNRMNILILDACRNNPFARSWRSPARGLAFINAPAGILIAYATAPGSVASDGTGANGLYTQELLKQIKVEGQKIEDVFKNVRAGVISHSNNRQTPWESSSLIGDFYFIRPETSLPGTVSDDKTPRILKATGLSKWKREGKGYRFYRNGVDISGETTTCTPDDNALLYDRTTNSNFLLKDYRSIHDQKLRDAIEIVSRSNAFWTREKGNEFRFYLKGSEKTRISKYAWYRNDLLVYLPEENMYFQMTGFSEAESGKLFTAKYIYSPNHTLWWADDTCYYLYVNGDQIAARTYFEWSGNDLIVFDKQSRSSFKLPDYYNCNDGLLRPSEVIVAPGEITWSKQEDNTFWFQRKGVNLKTLDVYAAYSTNDLLIHEKNTRQDFLLRNYLEMEYNVQYPVETLWSGDHAFWRRTGNSYWLYVNGVMISERTIPATKGRDLELYDPETGFNWVLKNYWDLDDNRLRPASLK